MKPSHRHFEFGTFQDRVEHFCLLFEVDPPQMIYEDGEPQMTESLMEWCKVNHLNLTWLIGGNPCDMLKEYRNIHEKKLEFAESIKDMTEAELQVMSLAMRAVAEGKATAKEAFPMMVTEITRLRGGAVDWVNC